MRPSLHRPARALLLLALASLAVTFLHARASAETYWLDGNEVEVTLRPQRESFVVGERVAVVLSFRNLSGADLELLLSRERACDGWPDDSELTLRGPDGATRPRPEGRRDEGFYTNTFLHGGETALGNRHAANIILSLDEWAKFDKPGLYTVTCRRGVTAGPYDGRDYRIFPGTTRPAVEVRVKTQVKVLGGEDDRIGRLVEESGAKMLACAQGQPESVAAATRLAKVDDERVVRPFAEAMTRCKDAGIRYTALGAIANFNTDAAFEALRAAAADASEDFRTVAAQAVARNKHPKSAALLLSMRRDPYYGVRLIVLYALEAEDTEAARRHVWELTHDEHPSVRDEALRFLQQRPAPSRP